MYEIMRREHSCYNIFRRKIRIGGASLRDGWRKRGPGGGKIEGKLVLSGVEKAKEEHSFEIGGVSTVSNNADVKKKRI